VEREAYRKIAVTRRSATKFSKTWSWPSAKRRKLGLRFRYADDALSTRMYARRGDDRGWTKTGAAV